MQMHYQFSKKDKTDKQICRNEYDKILKIFQKYLKFSVDKYNLLTSLKYL